MLQEALLMGYEVYGTDLEPRMIDYSQANLGWLDKNFPVDHSTQTSKMDAKWPISTWKLVTRHHINGPLRLIL